MQLIVTLESSEDIYTLDVTTSMTLADLRAVIEAETLVPVDQQVLFYKAVVLSDNDRELESFGMEEYDMIMLRVQPPTPPAPSSGPTRMDVDHQSSEQNAIMNDVEKVRLQMLGDQALCDLVRQTYPDLAASVNDPPKFRELLTKIEESRLESEEIKKRELKRLNDDPYNEESQRKILELIQQEAIMENLNAALEHNPESFGRVIMLYVPVEVNGHRIKAFVDSGAQATIMSPSCAEACNVMFLLDRNFQGVARGVGTAKILGRIHIMEGKQVDLLLGLDMLKRHQASIDLKRNVLVIGDEEVPFLGEADLPPQARQIDLSPEEIAELTKQNQYTVSSQQPTQTASHDAPMSPQAGQSMTQPNYTPGLPPRESTVAPVTPPVAKTVEFSEASISQLEGLGVSREEAISALKTAEGDVEIAASLLFQ